MRRLGDGFEPEAIQNSVITAKREPDAAQLEVKRWGVFLNGVDDQNPAWTIQERNQGLKRLWPKYMNFFQSDADKVPTSPNQPRSPDFCLCILLALGCAPLSIYCITQVGNEAVT